MKKRNRGYCFPGYRYCGPGCSGPGAPLNAVDCCCQKHDRCYSKCRDKRYCDEKFQCCLEKLKDSNTRMGRNAKLFSSAMHMKNNFYKY